MTRDPRDPPGNVPTAEEIFGNDPLSSVKLTTHPLLTQLLDRAKLLDLTKGAAHAEDLRDGLERLKTEIIEARLDPIDRATVVKLVLDHLAGEKITNARPLVRAVLGALTAPAAAKAETPKQGRTVQLEDPEPWADPVDAAVLLDALDVTFTRYLALPAHASTALALWALHTFAFDAWFISPFLAITSPVRRCGKSLLLIVLGALVPRRLFASNVTPAALFRSVETYAPTLLIDEADSFLRDNDELRGVLNSGHTRTTAVAIRTVGDDHDPRAFSTWCPKAIALIGKLPATLDDRAIEIRMRRRTAGERIARLRQDRIDGECSNLRRQAARWAADHLRDLQDADPHVPAELHDRAADCWRPLLALADLAGGEWPARARDAALALSGESAEEDATTLLLRDIRAIFDADENPDVLASSVIVERLVALEDRSWREWSRGRPLSAAKLARMLAGYGVQAAGSIRVGPKTARAYRRAAFVETWERYISPDGGASKRDNVTNSMNPGLNPPFQSVTTTPGCHALQSVTNPMNTEQCHAVTLSKGGESENATVEQSDLLWRDPEEREDKEDTWLDL